MSQSFDFVVVGGGAAGTIIALTLARSSKRPTVLLLEAGSEQLDPILRIDGQRWTTFKQNPNMNWGYKTEPQKECQDRVIDVSAGRALGGSTTINFGVFTVGAKGDYDEWARQVQNDSFNWGNMQRRFKSLETFHTEVPEGGDKYVASNPSDHGHSGPIHVGYPREWERDFIPLIKAFEDTGFPINKDHNSGDPIGMSVLINSSHGGVRSTAGDALVSPPDNLTIITDTTVQRLIIEGKTAKGVDCGGITYTATKEVILSTGALSTPKILMHSGIGPRDQLQTYDIPVIVDSPVGQGLRDHYSTILLYSRADGSTDRKEFYGNQEAMDSALEQWKKDRTGPWSKFACEMWIGYLKSEEVTASQEFKDLPAEEQAYLRLPTVPHYEILTHYPAHWAVPNFPMEHLNYSCLASFVYNSQARGSATLQSSDPNVPLKFDPKVLSHPYDRRVAIESLRDLLKVADSPAFAKDTVAPIIVPKSTSDEDLLEHWRNTTGSSWHMTGTAKMGRKGDPDAVVDEHFRIIGVDNLRVADLSVLPVLPNGHTQVPAYLTGATCAEMLLEEYGLN